MTQMLRPYGVRMAAPMLDDRVVEACLGVRPEDRISPWAYKPLLTTAMRGLVPDALLSRTTKAEGSIDVALGMRAHGAELSALWDDSRLAALGLVDPVILRSLCAQPDAVELQGGALFNTVACEMWLRSNETRPASRVAPPPSASIGRRGETS
jgi:asparagine synthase (glutamine-hydrolysing)